MAEIARGERFTLLAIEGYSIRTDGINSQRSRAMATSYCIVDRDFAHREVWWDYSKIAGGENRLTREARAYAKLAELEHEYGQENVKTADRIEQAIAAVEET
jgi:hypothetical protein